MEFPYSTAIWHHGFGPVRLLLLPQLAGERPGAKLNFLSGRSFEERGVWLGIRYFEPLKNLLLSIEAWFFK